jgi:hypothetical protein
VPALLRNAGLEHAARREAELLRDRGHAAAVGWPGYTDSLWKRLAPGTP